MKKYIKEGVILLLQLCMFYLFPLTAGPIDAMGMVIIILASTLLLSFLAGVACTNKIKFAYPILAALLFVPTVPIYYNESALVHALWYLVLSGVGVASGSILRKLFKK